MIDFFFIQRINCDIGSLWSCNFELMGLLQAIKYYKTGELIVGFRTQDIFWKEDKTADFHKAILLSFLGILFLFCLLLF